MPDIHLFLLRTIPGLYRPLLEGTALETIPFLFGGICWTRYRDIFPAVVSCGLLGGYYPECFYLLASP